jgi:hypothetical protein
MLGFIIAPVYAQLTSLACTDILTPFAESGSSTTGNQLRLCKTADSIEVSYSGPYATSGNTVFLRVNSLRESMTCTGPNCHASLKLEYSDSNNIRDVAATVYQFEQAGIRTLDFKGKFSSE